MSILYLVQILWIYDRTNHFRSINATDLISILPKNVDYFLLQKELSLQTKKLIETRSDVKDLSAKLIDFSDTAALCSHMDLVVSVDTSVAHLAGAIGKRTMLMLPWWPDWRWGLDVATNIWYPSMMCLRQAQRGDWSHVLNQLRNEIHNEMNKTS